MFKEITHILWNPNFQRNYPHFMELEFSKKLPTFYETQIFKEITHILWNPNFQRNYPHFMELAFSKKLPTFYETRIFKEITHILWNPNFHYRFQNRQSPGPFLSRSSKKQSPSWESERRKIKVKLIVIRNISVTKETYWKRPRVPRNTVWITLIYGICFPVWYQQNWYFYLFTKSFFWDDRIPGNKMSGHIRDEKWAQYFCRKIWRKEITRKT